MANIVKYERGDAYNLSSRSGKPVDVNCKYETQTLYDGSKISVLAFYYANFGLPNELLRGRTELLDFWKFSGIDPEYYDGDTYVENYELVALQQQ